ncbi:hypothetical protein Tco_0992186 [Tanacetum coccineum]|uniref:Uncharacterized protein n=1 Tax=Tanacetum coccineum TaxID=301880 RepID=A0ABQ5F332_9ASTR
MTLSSNLKSIGYAFQVSDNSSDDLERLASLLDLKDFLSGLLDQVLDRVFELPNFSPTTSVNDTSAIQCLQGCGLDACVLIAIVAMKTRLMANGLTQPFQSRLHKHAAISSDEFEWSLAFAPSVCGWYAVLISKFVPKAF